MAPKKGALPCPLPDGWMLTDTEKRTWRLGNIIGKGGFGLIYLASDDVNGPVREDTDYVIKVEYHENGPLFSELKFYQRAAKADSINNWKKYRRLDFLGIPTYWGSGLSEYKGTRYRFMVMDRLGTDLQKLIKDNDNQLKKQTVLQLGCLMVDVLEYIHDNEYVHADIKAANLLLGHRDPDKVYLADYGLSYRYCPNGEHKEYKENPKKGHNGTIEYTSIDAHRGVAPSRRGDLEVLGYCLLHWQCGTLPWLSMLRNPTQVQEAKAKLMNNLPGSVNQMSTTGSALAEVAQFLLTVRKLDYQEKPNYALLRRVLSDARPQGPLDFSRPSLVESARLAMNRNSTPAGPAVRPKLTIDNEQSNQAKFHYRARERTQGQKKQYNSNWLSIEDDDVDDDYIDEDEDDDDEEWNHPYKTSERLPEKKWTNPRLVTHDERDRAPLYYQTRRRTFEEKQQHERNFKAETHVHSGSLINEFHEDEQEDNDDEDEPVRQWSLNTYAVILISALLFIIAVFTVM